MKSYGQFVKTASDKMGNDLNYISIDTAESAYNLYSNLFYQEKVASTLSNLYEVVSPGEDKLALDMVSANIIEDMEKDAGIGAMAGKAADFLTTNKYMNAAMTGSMLIDPIMSVGGWAKDKMSGLFGGKKKRSPMSSDNSLAPYSNTY